MRFHNIFGPEGTWEGGREKASATLCRKVALAKLTGTRQGVEPLEREGWSGPVRFPSWGTPPSAPRGECPARDGVNIHE